jgi:hydrogenase nickel insertion protein HypA
MHELAATQQVVQTVLAAAKEHNLPSVQNVEVEIGVITTYEKEPFVYYYNLLKEQENVLKDSTIHITMAEGCIRCDDCKKESLISGPYDIICKHCQSTNTTIIKGKDIIIKSIRG